MPARLYCHTGDLAGATFTIDRTATIGRHEDNDVTLRSPIVSSRHARIYFDDAAGSYMLEDLRSYNGTLLDGTPVNARAPVPLRHSQTITFGKRHPFIFEIVTGDDTLPARSGRAPSSGTIPAGRFPTADISSRPVSLTEEQIRSTVTCKNLVVRNLQVTQGYYRLSEGMRRLISGPNVSWCSFATHASKTAGQALRHELMPRLFKSAMIRLAGFDNTFFYLNDVLGQQEQGHAPRPKGRLAEAMRRVSLLVSEGNIIVYRELAWPFTCLVNRFSSDWSYDEGKWRAFLAEQFRPGPLSEGGQDYLIESFTAYYHARFATDEKQRAEFVLIGNLLVGLHEQTRLQPQIEKALAVPLDVFLDHGKPDRRKDNRIARQMVTRATTQMLMSITLPSRELKLTHDVVAPTGVSSFPADLLHIQNPRCIELVRSFETLSDTLTGSAAVNWVNLSDRMRFVVDFFRSHQQYARLWEAPFLPSQVPVIDNGHLPAGPL